MDTRSDRFDPAPPREPQLDEDGDALQLLTRRDWLRLWANLPARNMPEALSREIQLSISTITLSVFTQLGALAGAATIIVTIGVVPLSTPLAQVWLTIHLFEYVLIAFAIVSLRRRRDNATLTTRSVYLTLFAPISLAGVLWGTMPYIAGQKGVEVFYLGTTISALFCTVGFFWALGHWPLSMTYSTLMVGILIATYAHADVAGTGIIMAMGAVFLLALLGLSFTTQVGLVHSRYYQATARDREHLISLILKDYERGGHDFLWETDAQLRLIHVPPRMVVAARGDKRIARGGLLTDLLADHPEATAAIRANQPFQIRVTATGPDGSGELRLWGRPKLVRGTALGYRGVGSDEDAARRAAEAARISERLDAMVTLTSGLAHDFNNQLATVLGAVELAMLDPEIPTQADTYLRRAVDACLRTRRLTADLVVAAGYDATYQPGAFELRAAATEVIEDVRPLFTDVRLEVHADDFAWVVADRSHYVRALRNLVQNACQAVSSQPPDQRRVTVRLHPIRFDESNQYACTDVRDTGPGVPPELAERIFEPFSTTRRNEGGTGLGLSVARGFARQAGGTLTLEPTDRGASFRMLIPLSEHSGMETGQAVPSDASPASRPLRLTGRFLVVEDDHQVADNVASLLRSLGATAEVAHTVSDATARFAGKTDDVECVISDLVLPDGEGYEVIAALRRHDPAVRGIYMSGFTRTLPASVAPDLQCRFLAKPFSAAELLETLHLAGVSTSDTSASPVA